MRTLLLLRHAKSSWTDPALSDRVRPLAPRGKRAAERMAQHLRAQRISPDLVMCSPARRARETLAALRPNLDDRADIHIDDRLYGATGNDLLNLLRTVDSRVFSVLVVGHNPGLEDLAVDLAGDGEPLALIHLRTKFPTGALATLDLGGSGWTQLAPRQAFLTSMVLPRQLPTAR